MAHELEFEKLVAGEVALGGQGRGLVRDQGEGRQPGAEGLRALAGPVRPGGAVRAGRQRGGQPRPQRLGVHDHLLRPLPRRHRTPTTPTRSTTRAGAAWYLRQLLGAANLTGPPAFHLLTGNLSYQIEHHLFPDLPAHRLPGAGARGPRHLRALRAAVQLGQPRRSSSGRWCARSSASPCPGRTAPSRRSRPRTDPAARC